MNQKELRKHKEDNLAALFKVTSRCNDFCKFCIERKFTEMERDDLSFEEIKNNFEYLKDNYNLDYAVITGGEPTLHPDFIKIIDYFNGEDTELRVITNLFKFSDKSFFKKILPYFLSGKNRIIGSINDLPINSVAVQRAAGLESILRHNLPLMLITVIYKKNLESLADIVSYLSHLSRSYKYDKPINIELRMIYIEGTLKSLLKKSLPTDFKKIKKFVQRAVDVADSLGITTTLWNFPLCYLDNLPLLLDETIQERRQRKLLKVNKDLQFKKIQIRDFEEYFKKSRRCLDCKYNNYCSGVDPAYITKYCFPKLKPVC